MKILTNTDFVFSLAAAVLIATLVALTRALRKGTSSGLIAKGFGVGVKSMLPAAGVLVVAWMTADTMGELGVGEYLGALSRAPSCWPSSPPSSLFSPRLFSFSIGSTFGTFGVMLPNGGARIAASGDLRLLIPVFGAVLAGSIFGDHTSPLSDTTILSAIGSGINLIDHVTTQLPYALVCAFSSTLGYLVLGITENVPAG